MAPVPKDQKAHLQSKKKRRQSRPQKNPAKRSKLPPGGRRNICLIRLPKSCHLQSCPLMSWCFNRQIQDNVISFSMAKHCPGSFWAAAYRRMTTQAGGQKKQQQQRCTHAFPHFLDAAVKVKRKGAPGAKTAKPRKRYSEEEIFYRLAKPTDEPAGPSSTDTQMLEGAESAPAIQPPAGTLQAVLS